MPRTKAFLPLLLTIAFLLAPASAQALPRGFFGIAPQTILTKSDTARMRAGGVETIRWLLDWGAVQRTAVGGYDWSGFDQVVALAAAERIEVLPFVMATPGWLAGNWRVMPVDNARQRRAWSQFLQAAVERYGRQGTFWLEHGPGSAAPLPRVPVRAWQIWNEPNFYYFAKPASPGRYARLLKLSRGAVRRGDPQADIVLGGLFGDPKGRPPRAMDAVDFLDRLYAVRGIKATFDATALHPYAADVGVLRRYVEAIRQVSVRNRDARAGLYLTEVGWGSQARSPVSFEVGLRDQARELRGAYRYLIGNHGRLNLRQVDWFTWKDLPGSCGFCDSSGLFRRGAKFRPKPAWRAFVSFAR